MYQAFPQQPLVGSASCNVPNNYWDLKNTICSKYVSPCSTVLSEQLVVVKHFFLISNQDIFFLSYELMW